MTDIKDIKKTVKALEPELKKLAKYIHSNPELGLHEYMACQAQTELLERYGFDVERNFCGFITAYKAVYKGAKSTGSKPRLKIAFLAEYDALPDLGHACGHNLIAMVSVGSGIALREYADEYGADIYVIGTPAEETFGCKVEMANKGVFDDIDIVMMAHPMFITGESVNTMAIHSFQFSFYGKPAHAAASPEQGVNALDAVVNLFNMINALRQQTKPDARIHGIITKGGEAPNIIPDFAQAHFYVRSNTFEDLEELSQKVIACAEGAALGTGTRMEWEHKDGSFKDTITNRTLSDLHTEQVEKLGLTVQRFGDMVMPGSSDLGDVSHVCPAIQCGFDITDGKGYGAHTPEFAECAKSEHAMNMALTFVESFVMTGVELMEHPEIMKKIKEEFNQSKG